GGRVTAEVIDPLSDPELEAEAAQSYNIQPTPFQVAGRTESSVINAYFDILVRYGDQDIVLNFRDLINVQADRDGSVDVQLRNPEYDITSAIKKVALGFQSVESVLAELDEPVTLTLYITPDTLPVDLAGAQATIDEVAGEIAAASGGMFVYTVVNPDDPTAPVDRTQLAQMGLDPFPVDLFGTQTYYLHMVLQNGDKSQVIYPAGMVTPGVLRSDIEAALKRTAGGFLKTVGLWTPPEGQSTDMFGQPQPSLASFQILAEQLASEYTVERVTLSDGLPPDNIDALVVMMPQNLDDRARYAIDQYLMRGGALILAAGNYHATLDPAGALGISPITDGLRELLAHYGLNVADGMVMDAQNIPFPLPVARDIGGTLVEEIQYIDFPFFVDVRQDGMESETGITGGLSSVTMPWTSPVEVDAAAAEAAGRSVITLLQSTPGAWVTTSTQLEPNVDAFPETGYPVDGETGVQPLAVSVTGSFPSYFAGKPSPLGEPDANADASAMTPAPGLLPATIAQSPETARIVLLGSAEMANDFVLQVVAQAIGDAALSNVQMIQNAVDWATEDADLLTIRGRGSAVRLLDPLSGPEQRMWELGNYAAALLLVLLVGGWFLARRRTEQPMSLEG
ncbi:MAG: Gldg family protein, partial [Caldilineaceae bacterium]